jgi:hypothetical protein
MIAANARTTANLNARLSCAMYASWHQSPLRYLELLEGKIARVSELLHSRKKIRAGGGKLGLGANDEAALISSARSRHCRASSKVEVVSVMGTLGSGN